MFPSRGMQDRTTNNNEHVHLFQYKMLMQVLQQSKVNTTMQRFIQNSIAHIFPMRDALPHQVVDHFIKKI